MYDERAELGDSLAQIAAEHYVHATAGSAPRVVVTQALADALITALVDTGIDRARILHSVTDGQLVEIAVMRSLTADVRRYLALARALAVIDIAEQMQAPAGPLS